jgi:deoxyribonuclease IV
MLLGRHMPLGGHALRVPATAREIGCDAAQIFLTNPRGWRVPTFDAAQAVAFRTAAGDQKIEALVAHATYLINLASPSADIFEQSITLLTATLDRASQYGCRSVVFHVGSHGGSGEEAGLERLSAGIARVLGGTEAGTMLLLENDVGGGGQLGYRFQNLATVLAGLSSFHDRLGVCLDTAHLWGAGFDMGTPAGVERTLAEAEETLTLARVHVIHLNDTAEALGSHRDHHARIGEGIIPGPSLSAFLQHPGLADATVILETPIVLGKDGHPDWPAERKQVSRARALAHLPSRPRRKPGGRLQPVTSRSSRP